MRQIGRISGEEPTRRFSDLLLVEGIHHQVDAEEDGTFTVWVHDEARLADATGLFEDFEDDPSIAEAPDLAAKADRLRRENEKEIARAQKRMQRARLRVKPVGGVAPVTMVLIGASILVAVLTRLGDNHDVVRHLTINDYVIRGNSVNWHRGFVSVKEGEYWRILTPAFLHFGILHILFNLWWLKDLGSAIERHHGLRLYIPLLVLTSIPPNIAQYIGSGYPVFGGMSGVVYGLLGYIWIRGKLDPLSGLHLPQQIVTFMILWFFLGVFEVIPNIANWAHGVGLGMGMAVAFVMAKLFPSFRLR